MIDCPDCQGRQKYVAMNREEWPCQTCHGTGRVPDDFFPEDSEELRSPDEEPEPMNREPKDKA